MSGALPILLAVVAAGPGQDLALEAAARALDAWDVTAAEGLIANVEAEGDLGPEGTALKGKLRFYQGAYAAAAELLAGVPAGLVPEGLAESVRAAGAATLGFVEVATSDGAFRIRHAPGPDAVLVPMLQEALPRIRERLGARLGVMPDYSIVVEVYPDTASLARVTGLTEDNMEDSGTIAIAKFARLMITTPRALVRGYAFRRTLAHEYLHLLITRRSRNNTPIWVHEGIARYHEGFWDQDEPPRLRPPEESLVAAALSAGELVSFAAMSPSMALLPTQRHTVLAFAEVQTAVAYLLERAGEGAVGRLLDALAADPDLDAALRAVTDAGEARFEKDWRRWLARRGYRVRDDVAPAFRRFRRSARPDDAEELDGLDKVVRDHLRLGDLLRGRGRAKAGLAEYGRAEGRSEGRGRAAVRCRQASALLELDRPKEAIAAVADLPELQPGERLATVLLGKAHLRLGHDGEARRWLLQAIEQNPFDSEVQAGLVEACDALGDLACAKRARDALAVLGQAGPGGPPGERGDSR